jgi:hypothetical protein
MYGPAVFVLIASAMHIAVGHEPARSEVNYIVQ